MNESLEAVRALCGVTDEEWARMLKRYREWKPVRNEPALSGCEGHERGHTALRGLPSEVPGSTHEHEWVPIARLNIVEIWGCKCGKTLRGDI